MYPITKTPQSHPQLGEFLSRPLGGGFVGQVIRERFDLTYLERLSAR